MHLCLLFQNFIHIWPQEPLNQSHLVLLASTALSLCPSDIGTSEDKGARESGRVPHPRADTPNSGSSARGTDRSQLLQTQHSRGGRATPGIPTSRS